jgi:hypothetical protein
MRLLVCLFLFIFALALCLETTSQDKQMSEVNWYHQKLFDSFLVDIIDQFEIDSLIILTEQSNKG